MPKLNGLWHHTCKLKAKTKYGYVVIIQADDDRVLCHGVFYSEVSTTRPMSDIPPFDWTGSGKVSGSKLSLTYWNEIDNGSCDLEILSGSLVRGSWESNVRRDKGEEEYRKVNELSFVAPFKPIFPQRTMEKARSLFVLMPFAAQFNRVYDVIKNVSVSLQVDCSRADDIFGPGSVMTDIWKSILSAKVIIAELTGHNPNVFYELGIAHCLGKDVVLIAERVDDIPFDLRHLRTVIYCDMDSLRESLVKALTALLG